MKNFVFFFLFCALASFSSLSAQKQSNIWYFGRDGTGLDFNCLPPSVVFGHNMNAWEGCSSICDRETGKLLFYTNGDKVFDVQDQVMEGGEYITEIGGSFEPMHSNTQCLIIPKPGDPDRYYALNGDFQGGFVQTAPDLNGLWCLEIDMQENGGLGKVVDRFQLYNPIFTTEKLMTIPHPSLPVIWVIGHEFNTNRFFVYRVDPDGFATTPEIYELGSVHVELPGTSLEKYNNAIGELKASPDGSLLASAISGNGTVELFDFDPETGIISNARDLGDVNGAYGLSFSPDQSKLYLSTWFGNLFQYDLSLGTLSDIINSQALIYFYGGGCFASLKIGPDQKIYVSRFVGGPYASDGGDGYLGIINAPNQAGLACDYVHDGLFLEGGRCNWGLNNVMEQTSFEQIELSVDLGPDLLFPCEPFELLLDANTPCVTDYQWQDGSIEPTFLATNSGTYWVKIQYGNCESSDTIQINAELFPILDLGPDTTICQEQPILLDVSLWPGAYQWQDGSTEPTFFVESPGTYFVTVTNSCGVFTDSILFISGGETEWEQALSLPNVFTPDGDGINDRFSPLFTEKALAGLQFYQFRIFNRWGQSIFYATQPGERWDGRIQGKAAPSDVYAWTLEVQFPGCGGAPISLFLKGEVTVLR